MDRFVLGQGATVLFQGDSITDAGRSREDDNALGMGYPNIIAAWLSARYPERDLTFINRGISGDRVCDLEKRWTEDCIDLQPDWVSILIGINDTWRAFDSGIKSPANEYEDIYRRILDRVKSETPAGIILLEPFVLHTPPDRAEWRSDLNPRIDAARRIACDYDAIYVPLDGIFAAAAARREPGFWAPDGVHPSQAGHALISQMWIQAVGGF